MLLKLLVASFKSSAIIVPSRTQQYKQKQLQQPPHPVPWAAGDRYTRVTQGHLSLVRVLCSVAEWTVVNCGVDDKIADAASGVATN